MKFDVGPRTMWQTLGQYECEIIEGIGYTGWCRYECGRLADGLMPEFNGKTGETRYSKCR